MRKDDQVIVHLSICAIMYLERKLDLAICLALSHNYMHENASCTNQIKCIIAVVCIVVLLKYIKDMKGQVCVK